MSCCYGLRQRRPVGWAKGSGVGSPLVGVEGSSIGGTDGGSGREPRGDVGDGTGPQCITAQASGGHVKGPNRLFTPSSHIRTFQVRMSKCPRGLP
jgi:hypothetical protein